METSLLEVFGLSFDGDDGGGGASLAGFSSNSTR